VTPDEIDLFARAVDALVAGSGRSESGPPGALPRSLLHLASFLNESFPQVSAEAHRRVRVRRRLLGPQPGWRPLTVPPGLEAWTGRMASNPRNVIGTAALLSVCVLGYAFFRQRSAAQRPAGTR
jgi:hypothetical protein